MHLLSLLERRTFCLLTLPSFRYLYTEAGLSSTVSLVRRCRISNTAFLWLVRAGNSVLSRRLLRRSAAETDTRMVSTQSESESVSSIPTSVYCTLRASATSLGSGMVSGIAVEGIRPLALPQVLGCTTQGSLHQSGVRVNTNQVPGFHGRERYRYDVPEATLPTPRSCLRKRGEKIHSTDGWNHSSNGRSGSWKLEMIVGNI